MIKSNSKEAIEAIRAYIEEEFKSFADADSARAGVETPDAWDVHRAFVSEMWQDIARFGEADAFKNHWVGNGGFGEVYSDDIRKTVSGWLKQTEEESLRYSNDDVIALYRELLWREFSKMVEKAKPTKGACAEVIPYLAKGEYAATINLYEDGKIVASQSGLKPADACAAATWIAQHVSEKGCLPFTLSEAAVDQNDKSHDAPGIANDAKMRSMMQRSDALKEFVVYAIPAERNLKYLANGYLVLKNIEEDGYYKAVDNVFKAFDRLEKQKLCSVNLRHDVDERFKTIWAKAMAEKVRRERLGDARTGADITGAKKAQENRPKAEPKQGQNKKQ